MNINSYFEELNKKSQDIFQHTIKNQKLLGKTHHLSAYLFEFADHLFDENEKQMLKTVSMQLQTSTLNLTFGMYREAFSSIRLAFEMGLCVVYFSIHKLEHNE